MLPVICTYSHKSRFYSISIAIDSQVVSYEHASFSPYCSSTILAFDSSS
jgi:hypothetical protein